MVDLILVGLTRRAVRGERTTDVRTLEPVVTELDQKPLAEKLLAQAAEQGVELVGPDGLLTS
jgi:hypothetical protein